MMLNCQNLEIYRHWLRRRIRRTSRAALLVRIGTVGMMLCLLFALLLWIVFHRVVVHSLLGMWPAGLTLGIVAAFFICLVASAVLMGGNLGILFLQMFGQHTALGYEPVVPITCAHATDLPVPDTLVRASEEPMQAQESVMLRAVTEGQAGREAQLLMVSAGGQEQGP